MDPDARTVADYETLRGYIAQGAEAHENIEHELAVFIAHGLAEWARLCRKGRGQAQEGWSGARRGCAYGDLVVLLANIIES